jgi:hypothetical protein
VATLERYVFYGIAAATKQKTTGKIALPVPFQVKIQGTRFLNSNSSYMTTCLTFLP